MSFDKQYLNRKDKRKPYRGAKAVDSHCRNHGSCSNKKVWWMAGEGIFILALITLLLRNLFKPKIT